MNIPWKLKSKIFRLIDFFNAPGALYFLQKYVTKRSKIGILGISPIWETHKKYLKKYSATENVFEFGAGKNLAQNVFLSDTVNNQVVVDLNPMLDFELVNNVRCQISKIVDLKSHVKINSLVDQPLISSLVSPSAPQFKFCSIVLAIADVAVALTTELLVVPVAFVISIR